MWDINFVFLEGNYRAGPDTQFCLRRLFDKTLQGSNGSF